MKIEFSVIQLIIYSISIILLAILINSVFYDGGILKPIKQMSLEYHVNEPNINFSGMNESQSKEYILDIFEYTESKDCKYWSIQWNQFADEYEWGYKYIDVPNHVFGVMYKNDTYCLVDQNNIICG